MFLMAAVPVLRAQHPVVEAVERVRGECGLPGVSVAIFSESELLAVVFMGERLIGSPDKISVHDMYNLGSCTKPITATLAAIAVERGKVSWDTSLAQTFPELSIGTAYEDVTLEQLLTHRAGVATLTDNETDLFRKCVQDAPTPASAARKQLMSAVLGVEPLSSPGQEFNYSNAGYAIAGAMVERALGEEYEQLLEQEIFQPLNMNHTIVGWPSARSRPDQPRGHRVIDGRRVADSVDDSDTEPGLAPAGDVSASIEDFARLGIAHLAALSGGEGPISEESARVLHRPVDGYAMGWFVRKINGEEVHYHDGGTGRFSAAIMLSPPHKLGVVVATNLGGGEGAGGEACQTLCTQLLGLAVRQQSANK